MAINEKATINLSVNAKKAIDEMAMLQKKAEQLRTKLDEASKTGDTKGIKKIANELRDTERQMKKVEKAAFDVNKVLNNLSGASVNDINRAIKEMERQMKAMPRNSNLWKQYRAEIEKCRQELRAINEEGKKTESWLSRANNMFNKWGASIVSAAAALTGVSMTISKFNQLAKQKEDSAANLQALTGLDDASIEWLKKQAEELSTSMAEGGLRIRQSATEILEAYQLVGGAKPELLENKEALNQVTIETMRLATAAKMDLREAVDGVTLAMNQYGATADEVGRYVNTLAAGAKFGSAEVDSVTTSVKKAGVAASTAGIPIEQLVGAIEMLAERGIKDEVAGTGLKSFFVKLESQAEECRPSVVGLQQALENLQAQNLTASDVQKMFGLETYTVAQAMINSAEKVDYYTKAVTGTNAAVEQAAINSNTAAAKSAQASNRFQELGAEIGEKLTPLIAAGAKAATVLAEALLTVINVVSRNMSTIIALTAAIVAYNAQLRLQATLSKTIIALEGGMYSAKTLLLRLVVNLRKGMTGLIATFKSLGTALLNNPFTLLAAGIAFVISKFVTLNREAKETQRQLDEINNAVNASAQKAAQSVREEQESVVRLFDIARDMNATYDERRKAIEELHRINADYLGDLNEENVLTQQGIDIANKYIKLIGKQSRLKEMQSGQQQVFGQVQEVLNNLNQQGGMSEFWQQEGHTQLLTAGQFLNPSDDEWKTAHDLANGVRQLSALRAAYTQYKIEIDNLQREVIAAEASMTKADERRGSGNNIVVSSNSESGSNAEKGRVMSLQEYYKEQEKIIDDALKSQQKNEELAYQRGEKSLEEHNARMLALELAAVEQKKAIYEIQQDDGTTSITDNDRWNVLELERLKLVNSFMDDAATAMTDTDMATAEERLQAVNDMAKTFYERDLITYADYQKMKARISESYEKMKAENMMQEQMAAEDFIAKYISKTSEQMAAEELAKAQDLKQQGLINEETYQQLIAAIRRKYMDEQTEWEDLNMSEKLSRVAEMAQKGIDALSPIMRASSQLIQANLDLETAKINKRYDTEIEKAEGNDERIRQLEEQRDAELNEAKTEANKKAMAMQIAQATAQIAVGIINAWASAMQLGPILGPALAATMTALMLAQGAIQIAAIKKQQQAQAAGYQTGGYTARHPDNRREVGVVHANEFVANAAAVANPAIRPLLDFIDSAQRRNVIASVTPAQLAAVTGAGRILTNAEAASMPQTLAVTTAQGTQPFDTRIVRTLDRLEKTLQTPIPAYTFVTGKGGMQEAERLHKLMKNNARKNNKGGDK